METNEVFPARETNPADFVKLEGSMGTFGVFQEFEFTKLSH